MNVVDTTAWLEYFTDGSNAKHFANAIENTKQLVVPAICIYEVFKKTYQERGENDALQAVGLMNQGLVISVDTTLAISAAQLSAELKLPMADSIVLATAYVVKGVIWTQDADFKNIAGVKYFSKR